MLDFHVISAVSNIQQNCTIRKNDDDSCASKKCHEESGYDELFIGVGGCTNGPRYRQKAHQAVDGKLTTTANKHSRQRHITIIFCVILLWFGVFVWCMHPYSLVDSLKQKCCHCDGFSSLAALKLSVESVTKFRQNDDISVSVLTLVNHIIAWLLQRQRNYL